MANEYNYLGLVNDINHRVNESELSSSNFAGASGFYALAKDCVNSSIRGINQDEYTWPFNYVEQEDQLVAGILRYPIPNDAKWIDYNTFRIKRDATFGNKTQKLHRMDYEWYLNNEVDDEYNDTATGIRTIPQFVARAPGNEYLVHPAPDKAYNLVYEYYSIPVDLVEYDDVPTIPEQFRHVIVDGAMFYVYSFRGDEVSMNATYDKYTVGIDNMRRAYVNRFERVRDTRIDHGKSYQTGYLRMS